MKCQQCGKKFSSEISLGMHFHWGCPEKIKQLYQEGYTVDQLHAKFPRRSKEVIESIVGIVWDD